MTRRLQTLLLIVAGAAAIGFAILCAIAPIDALRGLLIAFVWAVWFPFGALILIVIHRLTGGAWGFDLAPVLEPAAKAILPVALLGIPITVFSQLIYRWASSPEVPDFVAAYYLNGPFFAARTFAALAFWSLLAWLPSLRASLRGAALSLIGLMLATNIVPVDWVVSAEPGFYSSAFGFAFAIEAILAALGLCAFVAIQGESPRACRDLAGLIVAALLGTVYFDYMQFIIIWYGDLPEKAVWYIARGSLPWAPVGAAAFLCGAALPFLLLLHKQARESASALRLAGAGILAGITLHAIWLLAPSFTGNVLPPALSSMTMAASLFAIWLDRFGSGLRALHGRNETASPHV
jgi:hypothetical protein